MHYRPEIDGLRALAILPVIFYHSGLDLFKGGYLGVDIFFVISGYLISTLIFIERNRGSFSIVNFYERRVRRIYPALYSVLFFCIFGAFAWLPPRDLQEFGSSIVSVIFFISNHFFLYKTGYFEISAELKPLLHTWSLAVEEQYYFIFPIFILTVWRIGKQHIFIALTLITVASLSAAHWGSINMPSATFFTLPTRAWELCIGALTGLFILKSKKANAKLSSLLSTLGVCVILFYLLTFPKNTPSPSLHTLPMIIGVVIVIIYSNEQNLVGKFLSTKPMVMIGLISYSAYLLHQPIFAFARHQSLNEPSQWTMLVLSLGSLIMAYVSWNYVERPFRSRNKIPTKIIFYIFGTFSLILIFIGIALSKSDGIKSRFEVPASIDSQFHIENLRAKCVKKSDGMETDVMPCILGPTNSSLEPRIAVFGDSHSEALNPLFNTLSMQNNSNFVHLGLGGCPPILDVDVIKGSFKPGICKNLAQKQFNYARDHNIKKVFLVARWSLYTSGDYNKSMRGSFLISDSHPEPSATNSQLVFKESMELTIQSYNSIGANVYIVFQAPQQFLEPIRFYQRLSRHDHETPSQVDFAIRSDSVRLDQHLLLQQYNRNVFYELQKKLDFFILNPDSFLCDSYVCKFGTSTTVYYSDRDHLNTNGAYKLRELIAPYFN